MFRAKFAKRQKRTDQRGIMFVGMPEKPGQMPAVGKRPCGSRL